MLEGNWGGRWHTNTDARGRIEAAARTERRTDRQTGRRADRRAAGLGATPVHRLKRCARAAAACSLPGWRKSQSEALGPKACSCTSQTDRKPQNKLVASLPQVATLTTVRTQPSGCNMAAFSVRRSHSPSADSNKGLRLPHYAASTEHIAVVSLPIRLCDTCDASIQDASAKQKEPRLSSTYNAVRSRREYKTLLFF